MKRSGGVTASAVIAIIGSVLTVLFGGFAILSALVMRTMPNLSTPPGQPALPIPPAAILFGESLLFVGFGAWGIASAVGLLKLKNWARICFLVFAGLLCAFSAIGALSLFAVLLIFPRIAPPQANMPPGMMTAVFGTMIVFALLLVALGIWWLIYFNRLEIKAQFMGEGVTIAPSPRPLSITIIAWLFVVGGLAAPFYLVVSYPAMIFGFVIRGWTANFMYLLLTLAGLAAGIGLLRMRPAAHTLAVAYYVFSLLNLAASILLPGSFARMQALTQEMLPPGSPSGFEFTEQFFWFAMLLGLLGIAVPLWFLVTRRQAFLDACKASPPAPVPGPGNPPGSFA